MLDPGRIGENLGKLVGGEVIGYILGPVVAVGVAEIVGLSASFAVFGASLACFLPIALSLPADGGGQDSTRASSLTLLQRPRFVGALLLMGGYVLPFAAAQAVLPLQLTDQGIGGWMIGAVFTALAIPIVVAAPLGGRTADRVGALRVAVAGMAAVCLAAPLLGMTSSIGVLLLVVAAIGVADGFGITAGQAVISQSVPEERRAAALGLMGATEVLVAGAVTIPATALYAHSGAAPLWVVTAAATLGVVLVGASVVAFSWPGASSE
jgi:MFS family permease